MKQEIIQQKKRNLIKFLLDNKVLVEPEFLEKLTEINDPIKISEIINQKLIKPEPKINKGRDGKVKVLFSYKNNPKKIVIQDFINHFNARYSTLKKILQQRVQLSNTTSIDRLRAKSDRETVSVIGMVSSVDKTKNGVMLTVEDPTGSIKVYFSKNKTQLINNANNVVPDEVIGILGSTGKNIIFANELYFPEIPITKELKKSPVEEYIAFISDLHIGSKDFLEEEFSRFMQWLRGEAGDERQRELASKVKYLFITGDAIDGISVYPNQKENLSLLTYDEQYRELTKWLKQVPEDIQMILCPGQHDVVPVAEPQPPLPEEYCKEISEMPNMTLVGNPAVINVGEKEGFPGFEVLMYHGASYHHYAHNVESIRVQTPNLSDRSETVMKFLLQKRHLAPTYDGYPRMPTEEDHLIINTVPDIFVSGDVHKSAAFTYKGIITGIVGSCFQRQNSFQEKVGHTPDPGRVPILNLKTREVKILNFSKDEN